MHSILMMAVLTSASTAPGQYRYVYYGPCGTAYYYSTPWVAYYPVERVYAVADPIPASGERKAIHQKLDELTAMIQRVNERLEAAEKGHQAMEQRHREIAQAFERKLENQAKQQELALEARIKDERIRQDLETVKEKTRFLEYSAKILAMGGPQADKVRLEKLQQQLEKLEAQLKRVENTLKTIVTARSPEATLSLFEASEDQSEVPDNRALIVVNVPDNAKLFLNGQPRKGIGRQRFILTPQLEDGEYFYTLRVDAERDGRIRSQTRQVSFRRGIQVRVSFEP